MTETAIIEKIKGHLRNKVLDMTNPAPRRVFLSVGRENLIETVKYLKENFNFIHLSTITGLDRGENFEILYHFANENCSLTVRTTAPRASPTIPTITAIIPGAILYERELQDMLGLVVENIPDSRPLVLPDDWPSGQYPLRKDWKYERPPEKIPGGE